MADASPTPPAPATPAAATPAPGPAPAGDPKGLRSLIINLAFSMFTALVPGGSVVIEVPNMANFITAPYARWADYTHRHGYTQESLSAALRAAGFDVVECFGVTRAMMDDEYGREPVDVLIEATSARKGAQP